MKKDPQIYIQDMLDAIAAIKRYIADLDEVSFSEKDYMQDAVIRQLAIIGEAAAHIPEDVQEKQSDIPWRKIKDFRNVIIHEYSGVSLGTVWQIAASQLDTLEQQLQTLKRTL